MTESANPGWWKSSHYDMVVVEHRKGAYKEYCNDNDPRDDAYPMRGIVYPTDKGGLLGYIGEDGKPLDMFVGQKPGCGLNGYFRVWRPDVRTEHETKFFLGVSPTEKDDLLATFSTIIRGEAVLLHSAWALEIELANFRTDKGAKDTPWYKKTMIAAIKEDLMGAFN